MTPARGRGSSASPKQSVGVVFDAGALLEVERGTPWLIALLAEIAAAGGEVFIPAGALAQMWRGSRAVRLARLTHAQEATIVPLDSPTAYAIGELLATSGMRDVIDASVVLVARRQGYPIVTSDIRDLRRLDPAAALFRADSGEPG